MTIKTAKGIFEQVRLMIRSGKIPSGEALPTVRDLAKELDINRNTVSAAYKMLANAGIVSSHGRKGMIVCSDMAPFPTEGDTIGTCLLDVSGGNPAIERLIDIQKILPRLETTHYLYGMPIINRELENFSHKWMMHDVNPTYEINFCNGAVDGIDKILRCYTMRGDKIAIEDPCFINSLNMLKVYGYESVGIQVDDEGIIPESLEKALRKNVQAIIITPRAHNPTGCSLTKERARNIKSILARYPQVAIIIDDHFSMISSNIYWNILPEMTLHWALIRSVSKFLGPDLRFAVIASDPQTSTALRRQLTTGVHWVSHITQKIVIEMIKEGILIGDFDETAKLYEAKRNYFISSLKSNKIEVPINQDGLNIWIPLSYSSDRIIKALAFEGWLIRPGEIFSPTGGSYGLRITIANLSKEQMDSLSNLLGDILNS